MLDGDRRGVDIEYGRRVVCTVASPDDDSEDDRGVDRCAVVGLFEKMAMIDAAVLCPPRQVLQPLKVVVGFDQVAQVRGT